MPTTANSHPKTGNQAYLMGRQFEFNIIDSWGDIYYVGLTGIAFYDERGLQIVLKTDMVDAKPRDMN